MRRASTTGTSRAGRFSGTHRSRKKMTKPVPTSSATSARPTSLTTTSTSCCRRRRRRRRRRQRRLRPCRRAARRRPSSSSRKKPKARNTNVGVCRRRRTTPTTRRRWSGWVPAFQIVNFCSTHITQKILFHKDSAKTRFTNYFCTLVMASKQLSLKLRFCKCSHM